MSEKWIDERMAYLQGLKSPNEQQRLLMLLADKAARNAKEERQLKALLKAERAAARLTTARASAARIVNEEKRKARKARDRELYQSAGLLIMAGLVDTKTGRPTRDRGELLGALLALAESNAPADKRQAWKAQGDKLLANA